jgi:serine phosphatase RsbU (regulator of sigma subunit)
VTQTGGLGPHEDDMLPILLTQWQGQQRPMQIGQSPFVIGRDASCNCVVDSLAVSRRHAQITAGPDGHYLEDLGSSNGTYLNGERVTGRVRLAVGDEIRIGPFLATIGEPPDTETALETAPLTGTQAGPPRPLEALRDVCSLLASEKGPGRRLTEVATALVHSVWNADLCLIVLCEEGDRFAVVAYAWGANQPLAREGAPRVALAAIRECVESGEPLFARGLESVFPLGSVLCLPLVSSSGKAVGAIQLEARDAALCLTPENERLLGILAQLVATAIDADRLQREALDAQRTRGDLELAREAQRSFLPSSLPEVAGYELYGHVSQQWGVGGDYYDFIALPGGRLAVVVADVAGKGVAAALLVVRLGAVLRGCLGSEPDPSLAVRLAEQEVFVGDAGGRFITLVVLVLEPATHRVSVVNAGHISPMIYRHRTGEVEALGLGGRPLFRNAPQGGHESPATQHELAPGDCLIAFTDGVVEIRAPGDEQFGMNGLLQVVRDEAVSAKAGLTASGLGERIIRAALRHAAGQGQSDDMALVCLRRQWAAEIPVAARAPTAGRRWGERASQLQRLRDDLRAHWGKVEDIVIGRYLAGTASPEEAARVEQALKDNPPLRALLVRLELLERPFPG